MQLSQEQLARPITGVNLRRGTLADQLNGRSALLVFLRHLGCAFCRELVADTRKAVANDPSFPPVIYFFPSPAEAGVDFFEERHPGAAAVGDADLVFYRELGLARASLWQMISPGAFAAVVRAFWKEHRIGGRQGPVTTLPGVLLVDGAGCVLWRHEAKHAGDHPELAKIAEQLRAFPAA